MMFVMRHCSITKRRYSLISNDIGLKDVEIFLNSLQIDEQSDTNLLLRQRKEHLSSM